MTAGEKSVNPLPDGTSSTKREKLPVARIFSDNSIEEIEKIILDKIWKKYLQQQDPKALLKKEDIESIASTVVSSMNKLWGDPEKTKRKVLPLILFIRLVWLAASPSYSIIDPCARPLALILLNVIKKAFPKKVILKIVQGKEENLEAVRECCFSFFLRVLNQTTGLNLHLSWNLMSFIYCIFNSEVHTKGLREACLVQILVFLNAEKSTLDCNAVVDLILHFGITPTDGIPLDKLVEYLGSLRLWQAAERLVRGCQSHPNEALKQLWKQLCEVLIAATLKHSNDIERTQLAWKYAKLFGNTDGIPRDEAVKFVQNYIMNRNPENARNSLMIIDLLVNFGMGSLDGINREAVVSCLFELNQSAIAAQLIERFRTHEDLAFQSVWVDLATTLISLCITAQSYEQAMKFAKLFDLEGQYPNLKRQIAVRKIDLCLKSHKWQVAAGLADKDRFLQKHVIYILIKESLFEVAVLLFEIFQLPFDEEFQELFSFQQKHATSFLTLVIPSAQIFVVANMQSLETAKQVLLRLERKVIGLDVENQAECYRQPRFRRFMDVNRSKRREAHKRGGKEFYGFIEGKASILQISSFTYVFIIDLLQISRSSILERMADELITKLFMDKDYIKLGLSFSDDIIGLRKSYPNMQAFREIHSVLDMSKANNSMIGLPNRRKCSGLSELTQQWLGKPLDKSERMSNWARRPLTMSQIHYAALDSHCQVIMFEGMCLQQAANHQSNEWYTPLLVSFVPTNEPTNASTFPAETTGECVPDFYV